VGQAQPLMAELKMVFKGQVAQAPWKVNWLFPHESRQTPQELREYPAAQTHCLLEMIWLRPQV
jgi:hypothetical protein